MVLKVTRVLFAFEEIIISKVISGLYRFVRGQRQSANQKSKVEREFRLNRTVTLKLNSLN